MIFLKQWPRIVIWLVAGCCLPLSESLAQGPIASPPFYEIQVEGGLHDNFRYIAAQCWLPKAQKIKGILCVILHPHGVDGRTLVDSTTWKKLANEQDCALLGVSIVPSADPTQFWFEADKGSGEALLKVISDLADVSNNAHLQNVPIVLAGVCAAGQFAYEFAAFRPERTGAFVTIGGGKHRLALAQNAKRVPALLICTPDRGIGAVNNLKGLWMLGQSTHASWLLLEAKIADYDAGSSQIAVAEFLRSALARRHPSLALSQLPPPTPAYDSLPVFSPLSFLGKPLPALAKVNRQSIEMKSKDDSSFLYVSFTVHTKHTFDALSFPLAMITETSVWRIGDKEWRVCLAIDQRDLPNGSFYFETPIRLQLGHKTILGGIQVPIHTTLSRDIFSTPKALHVAWHKDDTSSVVRLSSRSGANLKNVAIESVKPDFVSASVEDDAGGPVVKISLSKEANSPPETVAGYVIVQGASNTTTEKIKIPFYGTIKN